MEYMQVIREVLGEVEVSVLEALGGGSNFVKAVGYAKLGIIKTQEQQLRSIVINAVDYFKKQVRLSAVWLWVCVRFLTFRCVTTGT